MLNTRVFQSQTGSSGLLADQAEVWFIFRIIKFQSQTGSSGLFA